MEMLRMRYDGDLHDHDMAVVWLKTVKPDQHTARREIEKPTEN